jgi:hypothetical protein
MEFVVSFEVLMACEAIVADIALERLLSAHCRNGRHGRVALCVSRVHNCRSTEWSMITERLPCNGHEAIGN